MSKHQILTTVINEPLGIATSADGVMMIFCKAVAVSTTFALDTAYLLTKDDDLATLGLTAATDTSGAVAIYQQAHEFYLSAGDGAKLWLVGVAKATDFHDYVVGTTFKNLVRGTSQADPLNRAKMLGFVWAVPTAVNTSGSDAFNTDVFLTAAALKTTSATLFQEGYQFSYILDGNNMTQGMTLANLTSIATKEWSGASVVITSNQKNGVGAVGEALGRFARITIGHGFGCVADGAVYGSAKYLTNGCLTTISPAPACLTEGVTYLVSVGAITYNSVVYNPGDTFVCLSSPVTFTTSASGVVNAEATNVAKLFPTDIDNLGDKQYMFHRTWFNHSGFFWNDGATADLDTKPLSTQEFNRVANRLGADVLSFMIDTIGKNVPLNTSTGKADEGYCGTLQEDFTRQYINPLKVSGGTGDITDGVIAISGTPNGTKMVWSFALTIVPTPLVSGASGTIEFSYTL